MRRSRGPRLALAPEGPGSCQKSRADSAASASLRAVTPSAGAGAAPRERITRKGGDACFFKFERILARAAAARAQTRVSRGRGYRADVELAGN